MRIPAMMGAVVLLILTTCGEARAQSHSGRGGGVVLQPWEGERLTFCDSPELSATIKVDSATVGAQRFSMGTGELAPRTSNASRGHRMDELIYFVRGRGWGAVGTDTVPVHSGTTLYLPQGLPHAFINPTDEVMEFVWVSAPGGFAEQLRSVGVPLGTTCPTPATR